jgi:hypothetical protein
MRRGIGNDTRRNDQTSAADVFQETVTTDNSATVPTTVPHNDHVTQTADAPAGASQRGRLQFEM